MREVALEECSGIDYGFIMESEESFIDFVSGISPKSIKGLLLRENGKTISTGEGRFINDLDALPFPKYEKFELEKYMLKEIPLLPLEDVRLVAYTVQSS